MRQSIVRVLVLALFGLSASLLASNTWAASTRPRHVQQVAPAAPAGPPAAAMSLGERMNANTVAIISGTPGATYFRIASDIAFALDDGDNLRILPVLGRGAAQNAYDIRFLKGIDLGLVRTDTLDMLRQDHRLVNVEQYIVYVARLFNDELHIIVPNEITDVRQLAGKRVNFDVKGSGSDYTGRSMFEGLGVQVQVENFDQPTALQMLKRGELAAVVSVAAKPIAVVSSFDGGGRFHLLETPFADALADRYFPATISGDDYPNLLPKGQTVKTMAVGTILAAYNWPQKTDRYERIARFVEAFFSKFDEFLKPTRHPKWREVNLAASVPGWTRFRAAQDWLDQHTNNVQADATGRADFQRFLDQRPSTTADVDRDRLFEEFVAWRRARGQ